MGYRVTFFHLRVEKSYPVPTSYLCRTLFTGIDA